MEKNQKAKFRIVTTNNYENFCQVVAKEIKEQVTQKPDSKLALPAGHSPRGYYKLLAEFSRNKQIDWQRIKSFALDDYLGVDERYSFQTFLEENLYKYTNLPEQGRFNPRFYDDYDQVIANHGGLDFCLLGLGVNGHIAFNEPPTSALSWTHCVFLTEATKEANKNEFPSVEQFPKYAITMGINTIISSKRIVLAVSGKHKKTILEKALYDKPNAMLPASFLGRHDNLLVITDFQ